jgi:hypothetical protein
VDVGNSSARWLLCFLALPALWIGINVGTDLQAMQMIPTALGVALLSAAIAYRSRRGKGVALGYFLGTSAMMGFAFAVAIATLLTFSCGESGDC